MFVIAVDDEGDERNSLATNIQVLDTVFIAVINGLTTIIPLSRINDVVPVHEAIASNDAECKIAVAARQHRLS